MPTRLPSTPDSGRGATANPESRYAARRREAVDDGWSSDDPLPPLRTQVALDASRTVLSFNQFSRHPLRPLP